LHATPDQTAETVVECLSQKWIPVHGVPKKIITDRGKAFQSKLIQELASRYSIKLAKTSAYHPQSNGKVERMHRDLKAYYNMFMQDNKDWEKLIPSFIFAHNTAEKDREKYSPAFLVYGRDLRHVAQHLDSKVMHQHQEEILSETLTNIQRAMETIKVNRAKTRNRLEEWYNKDRKEAKFSVGEKVYAFENAGGSIRGKFSPKWTGPWTITKIKAEGQAYDIMMDGETRAVNVDSIMREQADWDADDMKRAPIGSTAEEQEEIEEKKQTPSATGKIPDIFSSQAEGKEESLGSDNKHASGDPEEIKMVPQKIIVHEKDIERDAYTTKKGNVCCRTNPIV